jgi:hypothetical protein
MKSVTAGLLWVVCMIGSATGATAAEGPGATLADAAECRARSGLPNVAAKLAAGGEVRVAYLGGSITAADGYRPMTTAWLREQFPAATVTEIEAALSGTGSTLGAYRFGRHVLAHDPDLVFVEFAVNDHRTEPGEIARAMEGLVRQARAHDPAADVCFVYTLMESQLPDLRRGKLPPSATAMERVAEHYGVPSVHVGLEVVKRIADGRMVVKAPRPQAGATRAADGTTIFSTDGIHPLKETGHTLYAEALRRALPTCLETGKPGARAPVAPLDPKHLERATMVPIARARLSGGWRPVPPESDLMKRFARTTGDIHFAGPGETLEFTFSGTAVGAFDLTGPGSAKIAVSIDGGEPTVHTRFTPWDTAWQRRNVIFADDLPPGPHTVRVTVLPDPIDKAGILARRGVTIDDPAPYEPLQWHVSQVMVLGELTGP